MVLDRLRNSLALAVVAVAALGLSGCGRKAGLDLPPSSTAPRPPQASSAAPVGPVSPAGAVEYPNQAAEAQATAEKNGFDTHGNPVASGGNNKDFFLDFLLK